jgi:branched-subunit amino acid aminotransferase/4-amino-4-deoxychorismate lyase
MVEQRIDGQPASAEVLSYFVLNNYGSFTSMVVEDGAVRGLDLHLERLKTEAIELFGQAVPEAVLRQRMHQAIDGRGGRFGLRVNLFSPELNLRSPDAVVEPRVLTSLYAVPESLTQPVRVQSQVYGRELAHLKHNATLGLVLSRRKAVAAGYDDALFVDQAGRIAEGSIWNLGLIKGDHVVWPDGPQLAGVGMALIRRGLAGQGMTDEVSPVRLGELGGFDAAFLCNATSPACAIAAIDEIAYPCNPSIIGRLTAAWHSNPCQML